MYAATVAEPTIEIAATSGWVRSWLTASFAPWTTLKTPGGRPASSSSSAIRIDESGVSCDGLRMKVLPVRMALGVFHIGTLWGKWKGVIPERNRIAYRDSSWQIPL